MHSKSLFFSLILAVGVLAATNEPCYSGGRVGVCISASSCKAGGGVTSNGGCPSDPANIKCCTKAKCNNGAAGNCRWASDCAGAKKSGQCPGPGQFQCCSSAATGFGGYKAPKFPSVGACKAVAVNGAKKIVKQFPGRVREIGCIRKCENVKSSDHCTGKATDMMIADGGGIPTSSGKEIAEWVMKNRKALNLKYVIWGQRIWITSRDKEKSWTSWSPMEDRKSFTANHWDHVHVSYN